MQAVYNLAIKPGEHIVKFNQHFESNMKQARNAGVSLSDGLIIDCWLCSLNTIGEPCLLFHIDGAWCHLCDEEWQEGMDTMLPLQDMQVHLINN